MGGKLGIIKLVFEGIRMILDFVLKWRKSSREEKPKSSTSDVSPQKKEPKKDG
jgi:hypothetical protein